MKVFTTVLKILAALAAVAAIVYVVVVHGETIIAWLKKQLAKLGICCGNDEEAELFEVDQSPEEVAAEEVPTEEGAVQAEDVDFEKE